MKLEFSEPQQRYTSGSQTARAITELWVSQTLYCPNCGNPNLNQFPANSKVADFYCLKCFDQFELKSQKTAFGPKLLNGAYETKIERLKSDSSPNLILLNYDRSASKVQSVFMVPKRFFVPEIVEKRKPLAPTARRAGWVGSKILLGKIPDSGRIHIVQDGIIQDKEAVLKQWRKTAFLEHEAVASRGWLMAVMRCVESLKKQTFTLDEVYAFEAHLSQSYPNNRNVRPKIRQQLQVLRDNGYLAFEGQGNYRLLI